MREGATGQPVQGRDVATRWCEIMVRILSTLSRDGQLYRIDLRLRPSGSQGDLIRSLAALTDYYEREAEIWEMQSFLKARPVAGDTEFGRRTVSGIEQLILERGRTFGSGALAAAVNDMRQRVAGTAREPNRRPNIKLGDGGLFDVHFVIEFLQLRDAIPNPDDKDTLRLLTHLHQSHQLADDAFHKLYEGYLYLRAIDHAMRLIHDPPLPHLPADDARRRELALTLDPAAEEDRRTGSRLQAAFRRHAAAIHTTYRNIVTS